jgi:hypothetical protein
MYVASGPDEQGLYIILNPQTDVLGNSYLQQIDLANLDFLKDAVVKAQAQVDNIQAKIDAIAALTGGADVATQYVNLKHV